MAPPPSWVVKGLQDVLGLDAETITQMIIPDLESYTSQVRLRGHLQDFLGTAGPAQAFSERYLAHRFPSITATVVPQELTPDPNLAKPKAPKSNKKGSSASLAAKGHGGGSGSSTPSAQAGGQSVSDAINAAFGPGGRVYQKHRDDDLFPGRGGSGSGGVRSGPTSRPQTPRGGVRLPGAITITEAKPKPPSALKSKGKEKEAEKIWDVPKSKEVLRLEGIIEALRRVQAGEKMAPEDDKVPCFCQARVHELSRYTPQCAACGLILCANQPAHAPCPSCLRPTLSSSALARLIQRVEDDVAAQLGREQDVRDERERLRKERLLAESGGGAFPSLPNQPGPGMRGGARGGGGRPASAADAARKVLTIGKPGKGKGKGRATLTTTTYITTPAPSADADADADGAAGVPPPGADIVPRPRSPPLDAKRVEKELAKMLRWRDENDRPWADPKIERNGQGMTYIPPLHIEPGGEEGTGRRRKKKNAKGLGVDGRVVVGAAPA